MNEAENGRSSNPNRREFLKLGGQAALARAFTPLSGSQMEAISAKAEPVSKQALFFRFFETHA
jgi:uncharacterized protein (DUF1501 family)